MFRLLVVGLTFMALNAAFALQPLRPFVSDGRIKTVAYEENNVVPIYATTFTTTQIVLGDHEQIVDVQGGDADAWTLHINKLLPNVLNLKPTVLGSDTDIILSTLDDAKKIWRYFFHLKSGKSAPEKTTYAIKFTYPREEQERLFQKIHEGVRGLASTPLNPKLYHWDYSFHGTRSIMPLHIFDDGQFTYMQMKSNQIIPAVFAVQDATGKESVVNYRLVGDTLVIQQVAPQFTLRHGTSAVTSIFNNRLIRQINQTR